MTPTRDLTRERVFLAAAAGFTDSAPFVAHCRDRLEQGDQEFGDRWSTVGMLELLRELREEAADLGAWAALAEQAIDFEPSVDPAVASFVKAELNIIARRGAQAHRRTSVIDRLLEQAAVTERESST